MRVTYWTTAPLEPEIEAVSKEVFDLASQSGGNRIFAVSPHLSLTVQKAGRVIGCHPKFDPLLRVLIPRFESRTDVNHVYAEISPWLFHKTLKKRPIVLTIASEKGDPVPEFLQRCAYIAVQTQTMSKRLERYGVAPERIRVIYPGIDLARFTTVKSGVMPHRRPRILLATFPRTAEELEERGVNFLLQVAEADPDLSFTFLARPWRGVSTASHAVRARIAERGLRNVDILEGEQSDMRAVYGEHDFTVIPFAVVDGGKECPRSLVETMACGVPVLISNVAPFSKFVEQNGCGKSFALTPEAFAVAIQAAQREYGALSATAARVARVNFDRGSTLRSYAELYRKAVA